MHISQLEFDKIEGKKFTFAFGMTSSSKQQPTITILKGDFM